MKVCYGCRFFLNQRGGICGQGQECNEADQQGFCIFKQEGKPAELIGKPLKYWEWNKPNQRVEQAPKAIRLLGGCKLIHYEMKRVNGEKRITVGFGQVDKSKRTWELSHNLRVQLKKIYGGSICQVRQLRYEGPVYDFLIVLRDQTVKRKHSQVYKSQDENLERVRERLRALL